jgi:hypothetical protein
MLVDEVDKGCPDKGCSNNKEVHILLVGAFVEGELHLSWMKMFPSPFMPFILYSLLLFLSRHTPTTTTKIFFFFLSFLRGTESPNFYGA